MSVFQYGGTNTANLSSNSLVVTGSGTAMRGQFFGVNVVNVSACLVQVFDSQVSTKQGRLLAGLGVGDGGVPVGSYIATVPMAYNQGLFVNNSNALSVVVQYQSFMVQRS